MSRIKTHCKHGHPLSGDNVVFDSWGRHQCVTCRGEKTPEEKKLARQEYDKQRWANRLPETELDRGKRRIAQTRYRENHPEENRQRQRDWKRREMLDRPEHVRARNYRTGIMRRFGITAEVYKAKLAAQNNLCMLCGKPFDYSNEMTRPHLDHNHQTDKLRDFIHGACNLGIGHFHDSPAMCRKAEEYLLRHKEAHDGTSGV